METYKPWMKYINVDRAISIFRLIGEKDNGLSFAEIRKNGIDDDILRNIKGKFLSKSTIHCYLNFLKRLNLINNVHGIYKISKDEKAIKLFSCGKDNNVAKEILASAVVADLDYRHYFFDLMMATKDYGLDDLRKKGAPIKLLTQDMEAVLDANGGIEYIRPKPNLMKVIAADGRTLFLKNIKEKDAVFNGVRKWAMELGITDELLPSYSKGYLIAPSELLLTSVRSFYLQLALV